MDLCTSDLNLTQHQCYICLLFLLEEDQMLTRQKEKTPILASWYNKDTLCDGQREPVRKFRPSSNFVDNSPLPIAMSVNFIQNMNTFPMI